MYVLKKDHTHTHTHTPRARGGKRKEEKKKKTETRVHGRRRCRCRHRRRCCCCCRGCCRCDDYRDDCCASRDDYSSRYYYYYYCGVVIPIANTLPGLGFLFLVLWLSWLSLSPSRLGRPKKPGRTPVRLLPVCLSVRLSEASRPLPGKNFFSFPLVWQ